MWLSLSSSVNSPCQATCADVLRKQLILPRLPEDVREPNLNNKPPHARTSIEAMFDISLGHHSSISSHASTASSTEDLRVLNYNAPSSVQVPRDINYDKIEQSTPENFAQWFPSNETLFLRHDDEVIDGNMCLKLFTATDHGYGPPLQLFYLRMHDLQKREFSLRRFGRESGREVCHTSRIYKRGQPTRSRVRRSIRNSIGSIRNFSRRSSRSSQTSGRSSQSGTESANYHSESALTEASEADVQDNSFSPQIADDMISSEPTSRISLEFSNYAKVDLSRKGYGSHRHYDFEYWGTSYHWERLKSNESSGRKRSYSLYRSRSDQVVAHITLQDCKDSEIRVEEASGGWVPPVWMRITDPSISAKTPNDIPE